MSRAEWIESLVMLLCVFLLWPFVRAMRGGVPLPPYYEFVLIGAAVALGIITIRRVQRLRRAFREQNRRKGPPQFPF